MQQRTPKLWGMTVLLFAAVMVLILTHNVPIALSPDDKVYAGRILSQAGYDPIRMQAGAHPDFEAEVRTIVKVQDAVLAAAPENRGIPLEAEREPKDVFERKHGLCYDRSRAIEKILSWLGFEARHVSVYAAPSSPVMALLNPQTPSHAVTEVWTHKGWMVIDPNARWIGLDADRDAVSLDDLQDMSLRPWAPEARDPIHKIFLKPFVHIRGLYSRHGYFYPPFTPIPDVNFRQMLSNVVD